MLIELWLQFNRNSRSKGAMRGCFATARRLGAVAGLFC